jgi:hypothetical protein
LVYAASAALTAALVAAFKGAASAPMMVPPAPMRIADMPESSVPPVWSSVSEAGTLSILRASSVAVRRTAPTSLPSSVPTDMRIVSSALM